MKIYLIVLISLLFLPIAKSGGAIPICAACIVLCISPYAPVCGGCLATFCGAAPFATACFDPDTKISKIEDCQIKEVSIYELQKNDFIFLSNINTTALVC